MAKISEKAIYFALMSLLVLMTGVSLSTMTSAASVGPPDTIPPQPYLLEGDPSPHLRAPDAPDRLGCFMYTNQTGWFDIPCMSEDELRMQPPPVIGGNSGVPGVSTTSNSHNKGEVYIYFDTYSGETDSVYGTSNTWSIQLNPETYWKNGVEYGVQFTDTNRPSTSNNVCVWSIDVTHQLYPNNCAATRPPNQVLQAGYSSYVEGSITTSGLLQTNFCYNLSNPQCIAVTKGDTYGFNGNWDKSSGTILGLAGSSRAVFTSPTNVMTTAYIFPGGGTATTYTDYSTGEENNLTAGTKSTGCNSFYCTTTWWSTN